MEIIASIIEVVGNGATNGLIIKQISTSSAQVKKYLESLITLGLIETDIKEERVLYRASEKGLAFLRQYYILQEMLFSGVRSKLNNTIHATGYDLSNVELQPSNILWKRTVKFVRRS